MIHETHEIVVLGAGFAGSLFALGARRLGRDVALFDKSRHPRFAIGESSTPVADRVLRDLAARYDLPRIEPLAKYGSWQRTYPELGCGLKRGFSYFEHRPGEPFRVDAEHGNELLVAASSDDATSDTHWLRADVDQFLADEARDGGVPVWEDSRIDSLTLDEHGWWTVRGERPVAPRGGADARREAFEVRTRLVIDGTGEASVVARALAIPPETDQLYTTSRSLFSHFWGVGSWTQWLDEHGARTDEHPFPCDAAAQHMLLDGAWMWVLRFNHGLTSVGLAIDERRHPLPAKQTPADEWREWLDRYPSVAEMLANTRIAKPPGQMIRTGRIQRRAGRAAGASWAALPHTAGFIDPLHSSGIAHSLCGVERLLDLIDRQWGSASFAEGLADYERAVFRELDLIDRLVHGCYASLGRFRRFAAWSMLYFAAATTYEKRRSVAGYDPRVWFLNAGDETFFGVIEALHRQLADVPRTDEAERGFEREVARRLAPYNHVGLFDPEVRNMYRHTVAPE